MSAQKGDAMTEAEFFELFDNERWNFTFMDEADIAKPVQQVGLMAVFYLVDAYLPVRRKHIAEAFSLYDKYFGDKLHGGYRSRLVFLRHASGAADV